MHDIVFTGAQLYDGSGAPARRTGLAVCNGRIAAIGDNLGPAALTIDADGLALMPGIIDGHTHYDAQLTWDALADPSLSLGVTTVVIGNCGFTIAPCKPEDRDLTMRNLTHVEGMSLEALRTGIRWEFESFREYLAMLERQGVGPNVAAFVGHSSLRTYVMGQDASQRSATDAEVGAMCALLRDAMEAGAVGFASSTNEPHNGEGGVPMPSRLADEREFQALLGQLGNAGRGLFMLTKGSKTTIPFLESLAAESGRPVLVAALFHDETNPTRVFDLLEQINSAQRRGNRVYAQVSCCPLTMDFTFENPYVLESIDAWRPVMEASPQQARELMADTAFREAVKADLVRLRGQRMFNSRWDRVHLSGVARPAFAHLEGSSIEKLAAQDGRHPLDWMLDFALAEDLKTLFTAEMRNTDREAVGRLITDPQAHVSLSDAGAHLTFLCDAAFGLHLMGFWSRDAGVLPLEQAVHKLTGHPADIFGIRDRGRLEMGMAADLLLFDPASVGREPNVRAADLPSGATRLVGKGRGVHGVWINGVRVFENDRVLTGMQPPGKVLRTFEN